MHKPAGEMRTRPAFACRAPSSARAGDCQTDCCWRSPTRWSACGHPAVVRLTLSHRVPAVFMTPMVVAAAQCKMLFYPDDLRSRRQPHKPPDRSRPHCHGQRYNTARQPYVRPSTRWRKAVSNRRFRRERSTALSAPATPRVLWRRNLLDDRVCMTLRTISPA
jgi:hypothetical protein